jgi:hypothetical protein
MIEQIGCEARVGGRMKSRNTSWIRVALMMAASAVVFSCSSDLTRSSSPVELVVTNKQDIQHIDLNGNGSSGNTNCNQNIGTVNIEARLKNPASGVDQQFNDVRITRYRVSYVRTDGGTAVPASFVRTIDLLVPATGAPTPLGNFVILTADAVAQAPFASLLPTNGGRDPQTGRGIVQMDVTLEIFGSTLAGTNVSGSTRFPLDFCFNCGGCA